MLDFHDEVLLVDFGSSKKVKQSLFETDQEINENYGMTTTGFVGTIHYMAPEIV